MDLHELADDTELHAVIERSVRNVAGDEIADVFRGGLEEAGVVRSRLAQHDRDEVERYAPEAIEKARTQESAGGDSGARHP